MIHSIQNNPQIQCDTNKNLRPFLFTNTKKFTMYKKTHKIPDKQTNPEENNRAIGIILVDLKLH